MTPWRVSLLAALVALVAVASVLAPATAQDNETATGNETAPTDGAPEAGDDGVNATAEVGDGARTYLVEALDLECPEAAPGEPCWTIMWLEALPGEQVRVIADYTASEVPHNIHFEDPLGIQTEIVTGGTQTVDFTMPEGQTAPIRYICDVHPTTMIGFVAPPGLAVAGGGGAGEGAHTGITAIGVHYLAYWVGVIAFIVLFVVYGLTFFLFKYGESNATTDHMDRPGAAAGSPGENRARAWLLVGVTAIVVVGGMLLAAAKMG